jgi:hypothetical protein
MFRFQKMRWVLPGGRSMLRPYADSGRFANRPYGISVNAIHRYGDCGRHECRPYKNTRRSASADKPQGSPLRGIGRLASRPYKITGDPPRRINRKGRPSEYDCRVSPLRVGTATYGNQILKLSSGKYKQSFYGSTWVFSYDIRRYFRKYLIIKNIAETAKENKIQEANGNIIVAFCL